MSEKVLSIIIPTYNMENYISKCLDSLLIPSIDLIEVLVINDGSKDKSSEIAHKYAEKHPGSIRVIDKENGNYGSCVNRGLKEAAGKYVKVLDADDRFETKNFDKFVEFLSQTDADCIITDYLQVDPEGNELNRVTFNKLKNESTISFGRMPKKILRDIQMHAVTYKTKILVANDYLQTEGISYTDNEWVFLPLAWCETFIYYPHIIYLYLIGREGQTVDPKTRDKSYHHSLKGLETELTHLRTRKFDNDEKKQFLINKFIKRLDNIYKLGITGTATMQEKLAIFDEAYKKNFLENEIDLAKSLTIPILTYNYLTIWRQSGYKVNFEIPKYAILFEKVLKRLNIL